PRAAPGRPPDRRPRRPGGLPHGRGPDDGRCLAGSTRAGAPCRCILRVMVKTAAILFVCALVIGVSAPARAGSPTDQLREYSEQVIKVLEDPVLKPQDRRAAVRKIAHQLFADLLESTYIARIEQYGGERIKYTHETVDGDNAIVRAKVVTKKGTEVPVESRLLHRGDRWLIYDVLIENVSLIANYRAQFDKIVRTTSYGELMRRLKNKRDEFLNEQPDTARRTSG